MALVAWVTFKSSKHKNHLVLLPEFSVWRFKVLCYSPWKTPNLTVSKKNITIIDLKLDQF